MPPSPCLLQTHAHHYQQKDLSWRWGLRSGGCSPAAPDHSQAQVPLPKQRPPTAPGAGPAEASQSSRPWKGPVSLQAQEEGRGRAGEGGIPCSRRGSKDGKPALSQARGPSAPGPR